MFLNTSLLINRISRKKHDPNHNYTQLYTYCSWPKNMKIYGECEVRLAAGSKIQADCMRQLNAKKPLHFSQGTAQCGTKKIIEANC